MILLGAASGYAAFLVSRRMVRTRSGMLIEGLLFSKKALPYIGCIIASAGFVGVYLITDNQFAFAEYAAVFTLCLCIGTVDSAIKKIPNSLLLTLILSKAVFMIVNNSLGEIKRSLVGFFAAALIFTLPSMLRIKVGAGDTKLAAVTGFYLGISGFLQAMIIMALLIGIYGIFLIISRKGNLKSQTAMGPYMAFALITTLVFPIIL